MRPRVEIKRPREMETYLQHYGWHFSRRAMEYATAKMWRKDKNGTHIKIEPYKREELEEMLKKHGIALEYDELYDAAYVATMCKADFMTGESAAIEDDLHMLRYVKGVIDDPDADDGEVFATWVLRMRAKGEPIDWEMML